MNDTSPTIDADRLLSEIGCLTERIVELDKLTDPLTADRDNPPLQENEIEDVDVKLARLAVAMLGYFGRSTLSTGTRSTYNRARVAIEADYLPTYMHRRRAP